jgi:hypothetical protein
VKENVVGGDYQVCGFEKRQEIVDARGADWADVNYGVVAELAPYRHIDVPTVPVRRRFPDCRRDANLEFRLTNPTVARQKVRLTSKVALVEHERIPLPVAKLVARET